MDVYNFIPQSIAFSGNGTVPTVNLRGRREGRDDESFVMYFDEECNRGTDAAVVTIDGNPTDRYALIRWFASHRNIVARVHGDQQRYGHVVAVEFGVNHA
jgi:hypothetical protein